MLVKHLEIRAFRGIESLDLTFQSGVNVLIGVNGVGKSTVIESLAILLQAYVSKLSNILQLQESQDSDIQQQSGNHTYIQGAVYGNINIGSNTVNPSGFSKSGLNARLNDIQNGQSSAALKIHASHDRYNLEWGQILERHGSDFTVSRHEALLDNFIDSLSVEISTSPQASIPLVLYYSVNRAVLDVSLGLDDADFNQIAAFKDSLTGNQASFDTFFRWFRALEDLENEERRDRQDYRDPQLEAVRNSLQKFLPEFTQLRVRRSPLRMTIFKDGKEVIVNQLSDGEKCLLVMFGDLARRLAIANPGMTDPLQGNGIILIDELELHLHPQWQRGILPKLAATFPNCQFVISTHSPQIVSDIKPENIYLIQSNESGIGVYHPYASYGRDSNQILELTMAVSERPQWSNDGLRKLFRLIEDGDLASANQLKIELEQKMGADEPDVMKAGAMIRRRELLGK
jgi:predicted ATP-binding protein involved in virulence